MNQYNKSIIKAAVAQGYWMSVADEEGVILTRTQNVQAVETHIDDVDEAVVIVYTRSESEQKFSKVGCMYFADGEMFDYTSNDLIEKIVQSVQDTRL